MTTFQIYGFLLNLSDSESDSEDCKDSKSDGKASFSVKDAKKKFPKLFIENLDIEGNDYTLAVGVIMKRIDFQYNGVLKVEVPSKKHIESLKPVMEAYKDLKNPVTFVYSTTNK